MLDLGCGSGRDGRRHYARAVRHEREQRRNTAGASPISARFALGESLLLAGALDEAETIVRARMADGARAARLLEQAWREGYSIYYNLWADPEFAAVRSHPAMRTLLTPRG